MSKTDNLGDFLTDLANAIRTKKGTTGSINAQNFVSEIESIQSEPSSTTTGKYACKVIDYDGTILKEEYHDEGDVFTLPDLPTHDKLIAQGFSAPYDIINNQITVRDHELTIGVLYTTASGLTEFDVKITDTFRQVTINMTGTKNWGDGTINTESQHTYTLNGDYTITCDGTTVGTPESAASYHGVFGNANNSSTNNNQDSMGCYAARIGPAVTTIEAFAFYECHSITYITLSTGVASIGQSAIRECTSLTGCLTIPDSVTIIGDTAFSSCYILEYIILSKKLESIGGSAFSSCYSLSGCVVIPDGITTLPWSIFNSCYRLVHVVLPSNITEIPYSLFSRCYRLTMMKIPTNVSTIGNYAFDQCYGIIKYDFSSLKSMPSGKPTNVFSSYRDLKGGTKIIVPDSLYEQWARDVDWVDYMSFVCKASEVTE